jgi:hypothetical protein
VWRARIEDGKWKMAGRKFRLPHSFVLVLVLVIVIEREGRSITSTSTSTKGNES